MDKRRKFLRWLRKKAGVPDFCYSPKWIACITAILYPKLSLASWLVKDSTYNVQRDSFTCDGVELNHSIIYALKHLKDNEVILVEKSNLAYTTYNIDVVDINEFYEFRKNSRACS